MGARWKHHHRWQWALPLSRGALPAELYWEGGIWHSRHHIPVHHEVRCRYPQGSLCQCCALRGHHHVHWHWRAHDQGAHSPGALHHEDQGGGATRAQVFGVDWWLHPLFVEHLPADVDLEGRVRRVRPHHCPPQVLLESSIVIALSAAIYVGWRLSPRFRAAVSRQPIWLRW